MKFSTETLAVLGRPVAFYPTLARVVGGVGPGMLLCQLVYWHGKQRDPDGWIRKSWAELEDETGLTRHEQQTARRCLRQLGLIEERLRGVPATTEYRLCLSTLDALFAIEDAASSCTKSGNWLYENRQLVVRKAATIPETTQRLPKKDSSVPTGPDGLPEGFATFWAAYPPRGGRRDKKAEAVAAWRKLAPGPDLVATILRAVARYARSEQLPVDAVRYLKHRRWEDDTDVAYVAPPVAKPPARNPELERIAARERELGMRR